jgi:hypothetical protein
MSSHHRIKAGLASVDKFLAARAATPPAPNDSQIDEEIALIRATAEFGAAEATEDVSRLDAVTEVWRRLATDASTDLGRAFARIMLVKSLISSGYDADAKETLDLGAFNERTRDRFEYEILGLRMLIAFHQRDRATLGELVRLRKPGESNDGGYAFVRVLSSLLLRDDERAVYTHAFLRGRHRYRDLVGALYPVFTDDQEDAMSLLEDRWQNIAAETWASRWRQGDLSAWYELLLGRFLGKEAAMRVPVSEYLATEESLERSPLAPLPMRLQELRCEFFFYDALKARRNGDNARASRLLEEVRQTNVRRYYENAMATFLLGEWSETQPTKR